MSALYFFIMRIRQSTLILAGLAAAGFLFRFFVARAVPQPFVYDQEAYYGYALGILKHGLHADLYRLYGYPLIIAPLIALFGVGSPLPWTLFHALLDTTTALMVFWIAKRLDSPPQAGNDTHARVACILYLFNPFTAGYTGVLLSEIVTVFLVALISLLLLLFIRKQSLRIGIAISVLLGYLPQVRPVFIGWSLVVWAWVVGQTVPLVARAKEKLVYGTLLCLFFTLPFWYTIGGNLVAYRQLRVLGVEPTFTRELYASLFIGRGMPFTDTAWGDWPVQARQAWIAFTAPGDADGRKAVADRHLAIAINIIRADPSAFIRSRLAKMGYVWEKHFIYPYLMGKPTPPVKMLIYWGNIMLLALAAIGLVLAVKVQRRMGLVGASLFFYITIAHMFSTSEERFSLPAYPWIAVFAGYAVTVIVSWFRTSWLAAHPQRSR